MARASFSPLALLVNIFQLPAMNFLRMGFLSVLGFVSLLPRPSCHAAAAQGHVRQMRRRRRAHSSRNRGAWLAAAANGIDPVGEVQQLAIGLFVEITAARALAED